MLFLFNAPATTEIYTLSLHDALPISDPVAIERILANLVSNAAKYAPPETTVTITCASIDRSEEHTSELQSRRDLVCRLLLEKKKENRHKDTAALTLRAAHNPALPKAP